MNMSYLNQFVEVAKLGNISKVAEKNHLSQSALSQQIKLMEQILDSRLLERSNKGVTLTPTGEIVYKHATQITNLYKQMCDDINNLKLENKTFHILATPTVCDYALPCTLYHIKEQYPNFTLELSTLPSQQVEEGISFGSGNLGFISGESKDKTLISQKVFSDHMCLVSSPEMIVPSSITKDEIYKYPVLMLNRSQYSRQILDKYLTDIGINPSKLNVLYSLSSLESIKSSATRGFGLAFLPYMTIKKELYNKQLRIIQLEDFKFEIPFYTVSKNSSETHEPGTIKLIKYIEKILADTIC